MTLRIALQVTTTNLGTYLPTSITFVTHLQYRNFFSISRPVVSGWSTVDMNSAWFSVGREHQTQWTLIIIKQQ